MGAFHLIPLVLSPLVAATDIPHCRGRAYKHFDEEIDRIRKSHQELAKVTTVSARRRWHQFGRCAMFVLDLAVSAAPFNLLVYQVVDEGAARYARIPARVLLARLRGCSARLRSSGLNTWGQGSVQALHGIHGLINRR